MTTQLHKAPNERPLGRNQQISLNVKNATIQILMSADAEELTFEKVAQQAGVNRSTLYRRWQSKDRLITWALLEHQRQKLPPIDTGSVEDDFVTLILELDKQLSEPIGKHFIRFSVSAGMNNLDASEALADFWSERTKGATYYITRAMDRGEIKPDIDTYFLLEQIFGAYYFRHVRGVQGRIDKKQVQKYVHYALLPVLN